MKIHDYPFMLGIALGYLLIVGDLFFQVFDATNTTRDRRDMILDFGGVNGFKVGR